MAQANIKAVITAEDRASGVLKGFGGSVEKINDSIANGAKRVTRALGLATVAAAGFAIKSAADFEQSRVAFDTMLGSAEKGRKLMKDISDFARRTPFELPGVVDATRQLLAYGSTSEDVLKEIQMLGDISGGNAQRFDQLALAFGQVRAKTRLAGQEMLQFTNAGVGLREELSKRLGVSISEIDDLMADGAITFEDVRGVLETMTSEGGRFFGMMDKQSKTFGGVMSNIRDQIGRTARSIVGISDEGDIREGSIFARMIKVGEDLLTWLDRNSDKIAQKTQEIADIMLEKGGEMFSALQSKIREEGFAGGITQALVEMLGKIDWGHLIAVAIAAFAAIAPDIVLGIGEGLFNAIRENPLDMAILFALLGFVPGLAVIFAGVLGAIPIVGPIAGWIIKGFATAAATILAPVKTIMAGLGSSAVKSLAAGMTSATGALAIAAGAIIAIFWKVKNEALKTVDAVNNAFNAETSASISNDQAIRKIHQSTILTPEQKANAIRSMTARADGGPVSQNSPYLVGERGPELFVPNKSGSIVPNHQMGGGTVNITVQAGAFMGSQQDARKYAKMIMDAYKDLMAGSGVMA